MTQRDDWPESQGRRFRVSTVNAVEEAVKALGYDAALARAEAHVSLRRASGSADEARLAQERLDCLRAYEETLRVAEAARQASSGLTEQAVEATMAEHERPGGFAADEPRDGRKASTSFERQVQRMQQRTTARHEIEARVIPTDVLVAEVERRGYSAIKVTSVTSVTLHSEAEAEFRATAHRATGRRAGPDEHQVGAAVTSPSASDVALLKAQVGALQHDLKVHESGYLALYREHERDLTLLRYQCQSLLVFWLVLLVLVLVRT